jgi:hypothetical protein
VNTNRVARHRMKPTESLARRDMFAFQSMKTGSATKTTSVKVVTAACWYAMKRSRISGVHCDETCCIA